MQRQIDSRRLRRQRKRKKEMPFKKSKMKENGSQRRIC